MSAKAVVILKAGTETAGGMPLRKGSSNNTQPQCITRAEKAAILSKSLVTAKLQELSTKPVIGEIYKKNREIVRKSKAAEQNRRFLKEAGWVCSRGDELGGSAVMSRSKDRRKNDISESVTKLYSRPITGISRVESSQEVVSPPKRRPKISPKSAIEMPKPKETASERQDRKPLFQLNTSKLAVRRTEKRDLSDSQIIYNLFNHLLSVVMMPKTKITFAIGKGNNHELVTRLINSRFMVEESNLASISKIIWSPYYSSKTRPSKIGAGFTFPWTSLSDITYLSRLNYNSAVVLLNELSRSRLFKFNSEEAVECFNKLVKSKKVTSISPESLCFVNHIKGTKCIARKAQLYQTLHSYCVSKSIPTSDILPQTLIISAKEGLENVKRRVHDLVDAEGADGVWILKPGEFTNRGAGIRMSFGVEQTIQNCTEMIIDACKSMSTRDEENHVVVQRYLKNPLLFKGRKFDIRCYALVTKYFGRANVFFYDHGYVRTSSYDYKLSEDDPMVHLTNEAVQVKNQTSFGQHEPGNKIYFKELESYFQMQEPFISQEKSFLKHIFPDIKVKKQLSRKKSN